MCHHGHDGERHSIECPWPLPPPRAPCVATRRVVGGVSSVIEMGVVVTVVRVVGVYRRIDREGKKVD